MSFTIHDSDTHSKNRNRISLQVATGLHYGVTWCNYFNWDSFYAMLIANIFYSAGLRRQTFIFFVNIPNDEIRSACKLTINPSNNGNDQQGNDL